LRALGVEVPHVGPGPFWAIRDGNRFLKDFHMHLKHVSNSVLTRGGQRYNETVSVDDALVV
jgi:hypothetical protein